MPKILLVTLTLLLITAAGVELWNHRQSEYVLGLDVVRNVQVENIKHQIDDWEQIASASPTYRDAYLQLAALNIQLGENTKAKEWLNKALQFDPNLILPTPLSSLLP